MANCRFPAKQGMIGKNIADQLAERNQTWKSYQESLPPIGADGVNFSDGWFTDASNIPAVLPDHPPDLDEPRETLRAEYQ